VGRLFGSDDAMPNRDHEKPKQEALSMKPNFKVGDLVEWNSEAGRVRGTIKKKIVSATKFKTYTIRASKDEPQYMIKSATTDHLAVHKGSALQKISKK
jgi:hypothetical protein